MLNKRTRPTRKHSLHTVSVVRQAQRPQSVFAATIVHRQLVDSSRVVGGSSGGQRTRIEQVVDGHRCRHNMTAIEKQQKVREERRTTASRLHVLIARRKRIALRPDQRQRSFAPARR